MKKILVFLLTGVMVASLTACGGKNEANTNTEATESVVNTEIATESVVDTEFVEDEVVVEVSELEGVVNSIYENHAEIELMLGTMPINTEDADDLMYNAGLASADHVVEAVRSESMFGSQAYSLVVVKVDDAANAQAIADTMYDNIDQRKWICVEAGDKMVATYGDLAMLIMVDVEYAEVISAQSIVDAFQASCGGTLDYTR